MKDEFDGKVRVEFAALRPKAYSYLVDDSDENEKEKSTKKCRRNLTIIDIIQKQLNLKIK